MAKLVLSLALIKEVKEPGTKNVWFAFGGGVGGTARVHAKGTKERFSFKLFSAFLI